MRITGRPSARATVAMLAASVLLGPTHPAALSAQSGWQAVLTVDPFPSPYMSDWEVDPTIAQLIVTNLTSTTTDVTMHYTVTRGGQLLLSGVTDPQTIPAGQSVVFDATSSIGGEADWNRDFERLVTETGRLPEGEYEGCVRIVDPSGFAVVERQCVRFATVYPDPPFLVFPMSGDTVTTTDPIFEWLPVQVPPLEGVRVGYVLEIAEVNTEAQQLPEVALESNIRQYVEPDLIATNHQYPLGALPFSPGRTYAWRVQALDGNGRPISSNQGRSEVWTFVYSEPEGEVERPVASIALAPERDTLRFSGDTARYQATAFDADNVEIPGKRFTWRSADTTVATVDTTGVVTGVAGGETQILASVDGVTDSALSVTAVPTGLMASFELYDPEAQTTPSLLELMQSGTFEEVVPRLMERLQSGEFRIPIPIIAALRGGGGENSPGPEDDEAPGGPRVEWTGVGIEQPGVAECSAETFPVSYAVDNRKKVFALRFSLPKSRADVAARDCLGIEEQSLAVANSAPPGPPSETPGGGPPEGTPGNPNPPGRPPGEPVDPPSEEPSSDEPVTFIAVADFSGTGVPHVALAWRWNGLFDVPGTDVAAGYIVIAVTGKMTFSKEALPDEYSSFFGSDEGSFEAGVGVTVYVRRRCVTAEHWICAILSTVYSNQDEPEFTIQAFAGVTASETSLSHDSAGLKGGSSLALGFGIQASAPIVQVSEGDFPISFQVGLQFSAQDSLMMYKERGTDRHNVSIGMAPTLTVWWGDSGELTLSIGVELPGPKLVVFGQLPGILHATVVRLGNPTVVFTKALRGGSPGAVARDVAISGTWGVGPPDGFRWENECSGDEVRTDIGGSSGCGGGGGTFEEMGRGIFTLAWTRMGGDLRQATDSLAYWRRTAQELETQAEDDEEKELEWRQANKRVTEWSLIQQSARGVCSGKVVGQLCRTWSLRGSVGNGSLMDLVGLGIRLLSGSTP